MDNEDVQENAGEPEEEFIPFSFRNIKLFLLPLVAWLSASALGCYVLGAGGLSLWLCVPLGLIAGAITLGLWIHSLSASTVLEVNISAAIYLILVAICFFVFIHTHAVQVENGARQKAAAKTAAPVSATPSGANSAVKP